MFKCNNSRVFMSHTTRESNLQSFQYVSSIFYVCIFFVDSLIDFFFSENIAEYSISWK